MNNLYRDNILDHYKNPRHFGRLKKFDKSHTGQNSSCGDIVSFDVLIDEHQKIKDIGFYGNGCAISQASASMLAELVINKDIGFVSKLGLKDIKKMLGTDLTISRVKCALLPLEVLVQALVK